MATMAHKRPRQSDVVEDGESCGVATTSEGWLSLFGKDCIHELRGGKSTTFARGGFGELSIALQSRQSPSSGETTLYSFAAVKTIHNAITGGGGSSFGGSLCRSSFSQQPTKKELSSEVLNELLALKLLQPHPNIVPLVAVYPAAHNHGALSLAFDYCPMDLHEVLQVRRRSFQQPLAFGLIRTIFRDVFEALSHCHDQGILHRDLKPGNLLVSSKGVIRLCDFGLAKPFLRFDKENAMASDDEIETKTTVQSSQHNNDKGLCTLYYRPPEVLLGGPSEYPSVDSWSAGTVLAELIAGRPLWPGRNLIDQLTRVFGSLGTPTVEKWPQVESLPDYGKLNFGAKPPQRWEDILPRAAESPQLVDLLSNLVTLNPLERFTAKEALAHDWLQQNKPVRETENDECHRELRNELLRSTGLQLPVVLFPENRGLVETLGLGIAESRRSLLSSSKGIGISWQGPTLTPVKLGNH